MNRLWAPWRTSYIEGIGHQADDACVFCQCHGANIENDRRNLVLYRGAHCIVMLNKFPYTNGHLMIIPCMHTAEILNLDEPTVIELWGLLRRCVEALRVTVKPDGFNVGCNLGRIAGAGIDQHLHLHIVPRWNGDSNFMSVIGEVKVISQSLEDTYNALDPLFNVPRANS